MDTSPHELITLHHGHVTNSQVRHGAHEFVEIRLFGTDRHLVTHQFAHREAQRLVALGGEGAHDVTFGNNSYQRWRRTSHDESPDAAFFQ